MDTKTRSICRFGAICALAAGILYICIVVCALFSPSSIATYIASEAYFKDFLSYRPVFITLKWLMLFANAAMIGVVCTFYALHRDETHGLMTWVSVIAIVGFSVGMIQSVQDVSMIPYMADRYASGNEMVREMIVTFGIANPAIFVLSMGFPGLWFVIVSLQAWSNPFIPKHLVILGLLWGFGNITTVIAHVFYILELIYLVAWGALVFAPLWSIFEGLFLLKLSKSK